MQKNYINYLLFILLALLWSGSFLAIKISVSSLPPIFSAMLRIALSLFFLTVLFLILHKNIAIPIKSLWRIWIVGLFTQGIPFALLFWGEKFVPPALASILNSTVSIWVLIINILIFHDFSQATINKITGLIISMIGILIIFWPMLHFTNSADKPLLGTTAIIAMAIAYAIGAILNQRLTAGKIKVSFQANIWHQHSASLIFLLCISLLFEHWPHLNIILSSPNIIMALIYMGFFSTAIAWMIYFYLIREWDAVRTTSVMYIVPVLAITWDYLFLHLKPYANELYGAAAILIGVILIQLTKTKPQYCKTG